MANSNNITPIEMVSNQKRNNSLSKGLINQALLALLCAAPLAQAGEPTRDVLRALLESSPRINAAAYDHQSAQAREQETFRRAWLPNLEMSAEKGNQKYQTENASSSHEADRATLRASQLVYDFGRSDNQVRESRSVALQAGAVSAATLDGVLLEGLTAHWSAIRSRLVLDYSLKSEASVRNLTNMENSLVELGKGYESNVLQAKVQLASAEARRVRAEGALSIADARVAAVFGKQFARVGYDEAALPAADKLPKSLEEAREAALAHNKQLQVGIYRSQSLSQRLGTVSAREFLPRLELVAEKSRRANWDSTLSGSLANDRKLTLQLSYNLNLGMAGRSAQSAAERDLTASAEREAETRDLVLEQVAISWRNLLVARQNKETLANQVRIAGKFFEMATAERQLGRRSLLDVLTAEVSLINAMSDLVSTEADAAIAGLTLLQVTGQLNLDSLAFADVKSVVPMPAETAATAR